MSSLVIPVPGAVGTPSAWFASSLSSVASAILSGASVTDLVALYASNSNVGAPSPSDLACVLRGDGLQAPAIPTRSFYAVMGVTLSGGTIVCTLGDTVAVPTLLSGSVVLDFGATPTNNTFVDVTGQERILATNVVNAFMMSTATSDHNETEHAIVPIKLSCSAPTSGVGFRIHAWSEWQLRGTFNVQWIGA